MCNAGNLAEVSKSKHCTLCVPYLEKEANVLKCVLTTWCDIKHDNYTKEKKIVRHLWSLLMLNATIGDYNCCAISKESMKAE